MNTPSLGRQLIYRDRTELSEHLEDNLLNKELYKVYLQCRDQEYRWKTSAVDTFNEVYYQCTRVMMDKNPEENVYANYLNEAKANIGTRYGSNFIFCMVWAIFQLQAKRPDSVDFFLSELEPHISKSQYYEPMQSFVAAMRASGNCYFHTDFRPDPAAPHDLVIPQYANPLDTIFNLNPVSEKSEWSIVTNDYRKDTIIEIIRRYRTKEQQEAILRIIENAYREDGNSKLCDNQDSPRASKLFFTNLDIDICTGTYLTENMEEAKDETTKEKTVTSDELASALATADHLKQELAYQIEQKEKAQAEYESELQMRESKCQLLAGEVEEWKNRYTELEARYRQLNVGYRNNSQPVQAENTASESVVASCDPTSAAFSLDNMVNYASTRCNRQQSETISSMLYNLALHGKVVDDEVTAKIDSIEAAQQKLNAVVQKMSFPNVKQFNNNPHAVLNLLDESIGTTDEGRELLKQLATLLNKQQTYLKNLES